MNLDTSERNTLRTLLKRAGCGNNESQFRLIEHGKSGDLVAEVSGDPNIMVKVAHPNNVDQLQREIDAIRWLTGFLTVPKIVWAESYDTGFALITEVLPGFPASHLEEKSSRKALEDVIATLAKLHSLDYRECPFDESLDEKFHKAEMRVKAGLVDPTDFDAYLLGWSPHDLLVHAKNMRRPKEDLVVTHGDASLPNFIWSYEGDVGLVDLGRFGVADRYQDFAIFLRSAKRNHPYIDAAALLREHYPLDEIDEEKCVYYKLLDEFF